VLVRFMPGRTGTRADVPGAAQGRRLTSPRVGGQPPAAIATDQDT